MNIVRKDKIFVLQISRNYTVKRYCISYEQVDIINFYYIKFQRQNIEIKPEQLYITLDKNNNVYPMIVLDEKCKILDLSKLFPIDTNASLENE